jgi:hypothetical protein
VTLSTSARTKWRDALWLETSGRIFVGKIANIPLKLFEFADFLLNFSKLQIPPDLYGELIPNPPSAIFVILTLFLNFTKEPEILWRNGFDLWILH